MNLALGLFVLSLVGADGVPSSGAADSPCITYDVRVITINGLEWRGTFFDRLQPVARQGGGSVWTASRATAARLAELDPDAVKAHRFSAPPRAVAHFSDRANRKVAWGVTRLADGPFDHATRVAYTPQYEEIREGLALTITGRKLDQGVLALVVVDDTRVAAVHQVALSEVVAPQACCANESAAGECCRNKIASRIEVPEMGHAALAGEWLIPAEGTLVLSLGVRTTADAAGKAIVSERLVLMEAAGPGDASIKQAALERALPEILPLPRPTAPPVGFIPMPMPAIPSRSLPQALAADGSPLPLPPLPEEDATPSSLPGSAEPCASPQRSHPKLTNPTIDPASSKAGFGYAGGPRPKQTHATPGDSSEPFTLCFPFQAGGMRLEVEVRTTAPRFVPEKSRAPESTPSGK
jgi:hypothetical protein